MGLSLDEVELLKGDVGLEERVLCNEISIRSPSLLWWVFTFPNKSNGNPTNCNILFLSLVFKLDGGPESVDAREASGGEPESSSV